jgi:integrase
LIFHDLRRTFVTDAEDAGTLRHEAMKISGHKIDAVYNRYAIENCDRRRAALDKIEAHQASRRRENARKIDAPGQPAADNKSLLVM